MEIPVIQIRDAIIGILKKIDPEVDVFGEEIRNTGQEYGIKTPETWYFVDIIPNGNKTVDKYYTDMGILVDIAYHEKNESNTGYLIKSAEIDAAIRPVLSFGGRKVTIYSASSAVSDHVLHYTFSVNFRFAMQQENRFEKMGELEINVSEGE